MEDGSCPYAVLGVSPSADADAIRRAYRETARKHHPDKHPGPDQAAHRALFERATAAMQVLADPEAKAAYDRLLGAREAAKRRDSERSAAQQDAKSRLEARETAARSEAREVEEAQRAMQAQLTRLRAENEARLQEAQARVREAAQADRATAAGAAASAATHRGEGGSFALKVRWEGGAGTKADGYTAAKLERLFSKYGAAHAILSRKPGRAVVAFEGFEAARLAMRHEQGAQHAPLTRVEWADAALAAEASSAPDEVVLEATTLSDQGFAVYEAAVLDKLRRAQAERDAATGTPLLA